jgi:N-acetylglutamate synthase-like GNAT family acetyltransferase
MVTASTPPKLFARSLAVWERDGLKAALAKARLPSDDVRAEGPLFWRFLTEDNVPAGFGGLEIHGQDALLRSVVILPPLRRRRIGAGIVRILEAEARALGARTIWLKTAAAALFFERLGYSACPANDVPKAIRASREFRAVSGPTGTAMTKRLG